MSAPNEGGLHPEHVIQSLQEQLHAQTDNLTVALAQKRQAISELQSARVMWEGERESMLARIKELEPETADEDAPQPNEE